MILLETPLLEEWAQEGGWEYICQLQNQEAQNLNFVLLLGHKQMHQLWVPLLSKPW